MDVFAVRGAILSSVHQFHVACLYHSLHEKHGPSLKTGFYWYKLCAHFLHDLSYVEGLQPDCNVETLLILLGVNLHPLGVVTLFFGVDLILPSLTLHWSLLQNRSSSSHRRRQL